MCFDEDIYHSEKVFAYCPLSCQFGLHCTFRYVCYSQVVETIWDFAKKCELKMTFCIDHSFWLFCIEELTYKTLCALFIMFTTTTMKCFLIWQWDFFASSRWYWPNWSLLWFEWLLFLYLVEKSINATVGVLPVWQYTWLPWVLPLQNMLFWLTCIWFQLMRDVPLRGI